MSSCSKRDSKCNENTEQSNLLTEFKDMGYVITQNEPTTSWKSDIEEAVVFSVEMCDAEKEGMIYFVANVYS